MSVVTDMMELAVYSTSHRDAGGGLRQSIIIRTLAITRTIGKVFFFFFLAMQKEYVRAIIVCIKYSKKLDQPVHSGRADWLPANPERGISPPQSN